MFNGCVQNVNLADMNMDWGDVRDLADLADSADLVDSA